WLRNDQSSITFDKASHRYQIHFHNALIDFERNTAKVLLGDGAKPKDLPLVGGLDNHFLAEVTADTTASLDPADPVSAPVKTPLLLVLLDQTLLDRTYPGAQPTTNPTVTTDVQIDPATLEAAHFDLGFLLTNLKLAHFESPKITLFSYGIPGVASID